MKRKDFDQLRKLMQMTRAENDGEALAAVRHANRLIDKAGVTWDRFFDRAVRIDMEDDPDRASPMPKRQTREYDERGYTGPIEDDPDAGKDRARLNIKEAFEIIERHGAWNDFLYSIKDWYNTKGFLTPKQREKLFAKAAEFVA